MRNLKTKGIIIKNRNFNEKDKIISIFSENIGKIEIICKSSRKITNKFLGYLEPLDIVSLDLYKSSKNYYLNHINTIHSSEKLRNNLTSLQKLQPLIYILNSSHFETEEEKNQLYNTITNLILNIPHHKEEILIKSAIIQYLNTSGLLPNLQNCKTCNNSSTITFLSKELILFCEKCTNHNDNLKSINYKTIKLYNFLKSGNYQLIKKLEVPSHIKQQLDYILSLIPLEASV